MDSRARRELVHQGDPQALSAFIEAHREELQAEVDAKRAAAKRADAAADAFPMSMNDWVKHLGEHDHDFRELLKTATGKRRRLCERIQSLPELEAAVRVYPRLAAELGHAPHWSHLSAGFYLFQHRPDCKLVVYLAGIGHSVYAGPLQSSTEDRVFDLLFDPPFHQTFRPISIVLKAASIPDTRETTVYALSGAFQDFTRSRVSFHILEAELRKPPAPGRKAPKKGAHGEADLEEDALDHEEYLAKFEKLDPAWSDMESVCSSEDSQMSSEEGVMWRRSGRLRRTRS